MGLRVGMDGVSHLREMRELGYGWSMYKKEKVVRGLVKEVVSG